MNTQKLVALEPANLEDVVGGAHIPRCPRPIPPVPAPWNRPPIVIDPPLPLPATE